MDYTQMIQKALNGGNYNQFMPNNVQKTPEQVFQEQRTAAYQQFVQSKEGIEAMNTLNEKFDEWYSVHYGVKNSSKEVSELKEMVAKQNEVMAAMAEKITKLSNQLG